MHFHLPKPLHGWRAFVDEIVIIVIGVLIALGFEQLVQDWHWRADIKHTRRALAHEIELGSIFAVERVAIQPCLRARIGHLAAELNSGRPRWRGDSVIQPRYQSNLVPVKSVETSFPLAFIAPTRPWLNDEWEMAKSTGVITHMDRDDSSQLEFFFSNIERLRALQNEEGTTASQLSSLGFDQDLSPDTRARSLATLGQLDSIETLIGTIARQMLPGVRRMNLRFEPMNFGHRPIEFTRARAAFVDGDRVLYGVCVRDTAPQI